MEQNSLAFPFLREVGSLPTDASVLKAGIVEAVLVVSPAARKHFNLQPNEQFRLSFEAAAFLYDKHGNRRPDSEVLPEVKSSLGKVHQIMKKIAELGFKPCFGRKEKGDEFTVGIWRRPIDAALPPKISVSLSRRVNGAGWPVNLFPVELNTQCERGLDEMTMAGITDVEAFREAF